MPGEGVPKSTYNTLDGIPQLETNTVRTLDLVSRVINRMGQVQRRKKDVVKTNRSKPSKCEQNTSKWVQDLLIQSSRTTSRTSEKKKGHRTVKEESTGRAITIRNSVLVLVIPLARQR